MSRDVFADLIRSALAYLKRAEQALTRYARRLDRLDRDKRKRQVKR